MGAALPARGADLKLTLGTWLAERRGANEARPVLGAPMTLAEARQAARQALQDIAEGVDPASARKTDRATARSGADRVDTQARAFIERYAKPRLRTSGEVERQLRVEIIPRWGSRRVSESAAATLSSCSTKSLPWLPDHGQPGLGDTEPPLRLAG